MNGWISCSYLDSWLFECSMVIDRSGRFEFLAWISDLDDCDDYSDQINTRNSCLVDMYHWIFWWFDRFSSLSCFLFILSFLILNFHHYWDIYTDYYPIISMKMPKMRENQTSERIEFVNCQMIEMNQNYDQWMINIFINTVYQLNFWLLQAMIKPISWTSKIQSVILSTDQSTNVSRSITMINSTVLID